MNKQWIRLAGEYTRAADAVRAADRNPDIGGKEYGELVDRREDAFASLQAVPSTECTVESPCHICNECYHRQNRLERMGQ